MKHHLLLVALVCAAGLATVVRADEGWADDDTNPGTVEDDLGKSREASRTDDETLEKEEEAIKLDGLSVAQMKELRAKAEKHEFQAEVNKMMKLIINSLYRNKEIFLRELISNSSDAIDKIRLLSLTDPTALQATADFSIRIKADKDNHVLHVIDTGVGMTREDLTKNLGTIARSGTGEFVEKVMKANEDQAADMIGQFGVGFYSSFLVADRVVVTSKHNDDEQYIWESDAASFSIVKDPRGNTLKRGTQISLHLKEEAHDFLEAATIKDLIDKYSRFINFNIYLWSSKTETVEEPIEEDEAAEPAAGDETEEEAKVEEEEDKPKTKSVEKTTWDWELINDTKPIWMRKPDEVTDEEYAQFYKSVSKDTEDPLDKTHFKAEGEVAFTSLLYVPKRGPQDMFSNYGKKMDAIKLYVRRVFITDDFSEMMPKYLSFVRGIVDSDDLPLNVSRETLQQNKLLKVIQRKLVRKVLDMLKKMDKDTFDTFWKEFSTNIKLGVMEDQSNKTRLSKLLRFYSSTSPDTQISLSDYVERMREKQDAIYYMCGEGKKEVQSSPFVERLIKKGYEVLYCVEPVDEYCFQALPDFDGKKLQNVAKEGLDIDKSDAAKDNAKKLAEEYKPLTDWLKEDGLKEQIEKSVISQRLATSPCALVASNYGWSGHMEKIMTSQAYAKANDPTQQFYRDQKKTLEINPRHPVIKELLRRVEADKDDAVAKETAQMLLDTATLRSGYSLKDQVGFAERIESILRKTMDISADEIVEDEPEIDETVAADEEEVAADADDFEDIDLGDKEEL